MFDLKTKIASKNPFLGYDLEKAFDSINFDLLFYCLLKNGLHGRIIPLIYSLHRNRSARIKVNQSSGNFITPSIRVPQGAVLSLLFPFFIRFSVKLRQNISMLMVVRAYVPLLNPSRSVTLPKSFAKPGGWSLTVLKLSKCFSKLLKIRQNI